MEREKSPIHLVRFKPTSLSVGVFALGQPLNTIFHADINLIRCSFSKPLKYIVLLEGGGGAERLAQVYNSWPATPTNIVVFFPLLWGEGFGNPIEV